MTVRVLIFSRSGVAIGGKIVEGRFVKYYNLRSKDIISEFFFCSARIILTCNESVTDVVAQRSLQRAAGTVCRAEA